MHSCSSLLVLFLIAASNLSSWARPVNSSKVELCDYILCKLPDCRCAGTDIPGDDLNATSIPQIITISFDDAFRALDYENYYKPVFGGRKNPNGCQIGLTYFVANQYTDYALMEHSYSVDHAEFADHSVTHRTPSTWWKDATEGDLSDEINDQKSIMERWGGIPEDEVKGFRVPFLATSENEICALHKSNFTYEASMSTFELYWPFTLDYKSPICNSPATCPEYSYPGLWLVPIQFLKQPGGFICGMLDSCTIPVTKDDWVDFLWDNFNSHYQSNRAPFGLYSHAAWFYWSPVRAEAMKEFLDKVLALDDVYIVTHSQMLDWVRNPTATSEIEEFEPWKCPDRPAPSCDYKNPTCNTFLNNFPFRSCSSCPSTLPTIDNPEGQ